MARSAMPYPVQPLVLFAAIPSRHAPPAAPQTRLAPAPNTRAAFVSTRGSQRSLHVHRPHGVLAELRAQLDAHHAQHYYRRLKVARRHEVRADRAAEHVGGHRLLGPKRAAGGHPSSRSHRSSALKLAAVDVHVAETRERGWVFARQDQDPVTSALCALEVSAREAQGGRDAQACNRALLASEQGPQLNNC